MKVIILAGGHSSRMGSPKHLLRLPDGPLYAHLIRILHQALPDSKNIYFSVADRSELDAVLRKGVISLPFPSTANPTPIKLSLLRDDQGQDIGPAAGLLAARRADPEATWLVVACDYPLLQASAVRQLVKRYKAPATCFKNADGFGEPLLGIWSPQALRTLEENVQNGRSGPNYTLKQLNSTLIAPAREDWLTNANTPQEWDAAKARYAQAQSKE